MGDDVAATALRASRGSVGLAPAWNNNALTTLTYTEHSTGPYRLLFMTLPRFSMEEAWVSGYRLMPAALVIPNHIPPVLGNSNTSHH